MSDDTIKRLREAIAAGPTPGPWSLIPQHGAGPMLARQYVTGKQMQPTGLRLIAHFLQRGNSLPEDKANASLIAAASPDNITALLDRLDKAERENERLRSESKAQLEELDRIDDALGTNEGPSAVDHIVILKTENERLREDAERYRWLRGSAEIPEHSTRWARWEIRRWDGRYWNTIFTEQVDAAIDAARAAEPNDRRDK